MPCTGRQPLGGDSASSTIGQENRPPTRPNSYPELYAIPGCTGGLGGSFPRTIRSSLSRKPDRIHPSLGLLRPGPLQQQCLPLRQRIHRQPGRCSHCSKLRLRPSLAGQRSLSHPTYVLHCSSSHQQTSRASYGQKGAEVARGTRRAVFGYCT